MLRIPALALLCWLPVAAASSPKTPSQPPHPIFSSTGEAKILVKADVGVLLMSLRATAPLAADALRAVNDKAKMIAAALAAARPAGTWRVTPPEILRAGGPYYGPNQPTLTGYEALELVYVNFSAAEIADHGAMAATEARLVDELTRLGASTRLGQQPNGNQLGGDMLIYALQDPSAARARAVATATAKAVARARAAAAALGEMLGPLRSVSVNTGGYANGVVGGMIANSTAASYFPYTAYSLRPDAVEVTASVTVSYWAR